MLSLDSLFGADSAVLGDSDFQLLLLANTLPPLGTALLSPVLDSLIEPFGTTPADIGLLMTSFTAPPILMIPVAGALADRVGRKPVIVASLLLFGTSGSAVALTTDFRVALALRFLQGIAFGGVIPIIITSIGDLYAGTTEATAQGLRFTEAGLAQTAFPLVAGFLVAAAWQYPFFIYALAVPIAVLIAVRFEEPRSETDDTAGNEGASGSYVAAVVGLLRHRRALAFVVARGLPITVWIAFLTYNSLVVVRVLDGTPGQAGVLVAVGSVCYAGAASQAGRITALFDSRFVPLSVANVALAGGFAVFLVAPGLPVATLGIAVSGAGFGVVLALYRSIVTGLAPEHLRAGVVSIAEANGRIMATLTPVAIGAVITAGEPVLGFAGAVQAAGFGAAAVGGGGGIICLLVARAAGPVPARRPDAAGE